MSRRRWLSTDISKDARVRRLAADCGEFAALVYSWAIPHAADDGSLPADPDELLMLVVPGFRWRTTEDMQAAIEGMLTLGLLEQHGEQLKFPPAAFYKYQTYVSSERREPGAHGWGPHNEQRRDSAQTSAIRRETPQNAEEQRESAQNTAFVNSSSYSSLSSGASAPGNARAPAREADFSQKLCSACKTTLPRRPPKHGLCVDCHGKALVAAKAADVDVMYISLEQLAEFARRA